MEVGGQVRGDCDLGRFATETVKELLPGESDGRLLVYSTCPNFRTRFQITTPPICQDRQGQYSHWQLGVCKDLPLAGVMFVSQLCEVDEYISSDSGPAISHLG